MLGEAKTSSFMLGTATVMIGAQSELFDLTPANHGVGLVKNFRITAEPSYTDLTQGVKNQVVYSVMTGNVVRASMEVFEYTGRNLGYALGLEGSSILPQTVSTTVGPLVAAASTSLTVADETGFAANDTIMIELGDADDQVLVRTVSAVSTGVITLNDAVHVAVPAGAVVRKSNVIGVGTKLDQPFLSAKVVGEIADGSKVVLLAPKIRITNGFSVGFTTENFDNLPYEFAFYDLVTTDPHYAQFRESQAQLITSK